MDIKSVRRDRGSDYTLTVLEDGRDTYYTLNESAVASVLWNQHRYEPLGPRGWRILREAAQILKMRADGVEPSPPDADPAMLRFWGSVAKRYELEAGDESDRSLYELAVNRLAAGDCHVTRYGVRVALRPDLGDDRVAADAYWPERERGCLCRSMKQRRCCSHDLAARILRFQASYIE
jgi:hypothetical protein